MADNVSNKIQRKKAEPASVPKTTASRAVLFQAADGSLYEVTNADGFHAIMMKEYGPKYVRQILGTLTKESLNVAISTLKLAPGAGPVTNLVFTSVKILGKGVVSVFGDAIAGKELSGGDVFTAIGLEFLKPSNYAPGGKIGKEVSKNNFIQDTSTLGVLQNQLYKYKNFITTNDPSFSGFKIKLFKDTKNPLVVKGDIGFFSIGKQAEKATVKYIKKKLGHKAGHPDTEVYDLGSYAQDWDGIDFENFDRFVAGGRTVEEAIFLVSKRSKGNPIDYLNQFNRAAQATTGFFEEATEANRASLNAQWDASAEAFRKSGRSRLTDMLNGDFTGITELAKGTYFALGATAGEILQFGGNLVASGETGVKGTINLITEGTNAGVNIRRANEKAYPPPKVMFVTGPNTYYQVTGLPREDKETPITPKIVVTNGNLPNPQSTPNTTNTTNKTGKVATRTNAKTNKKALPISIQNNPTVSFLFGGGQGYRNF